MKENTRRPYRLTSNIKKTTLPSHFIQKEKLKDEKKNNHGKNVAHDYNNKTEKRVMINNSRKNLNQHYNKKMEKRNTLKKKIHKRHEPKENRYQANTITVAPERRVKLYDFEKTIKKTLTKHKCND